MLRERALGWIGRVTTRHYVVVLLLTVATLIGSFFLVRTLQINTRYVDLLPQDHAAVKNYFKVLDKFGGSDYSIVLVKGKDTEQVHKAIEDARSKLDATGKFEYIQHRADLSKFSRYGLLYLDLDTLKKMDTLLAERDFDELAKMASKMSDLQEEMTRKFGGGLAVDQQGYFTDPAGTTGLMIAKPRFSADDMPKVVPLGETMEVVKEQIQRENPGTKLYVAGNYQLQYEQRNTVNHDMLLVAILALIAIIVILAFAFRSLTTPFLAMAALGCGIFWTLAFARITVGSLNTVSSIFAAVLMGIGIEYGIALLSRYQEERGRGKNGSDAFVTALMHTGKGIVTGALTTAGAFFAIAFSEFKAMHDMGIMLGIGVICALASTFFVLPALMTLKERFLPGTASRRGGESKVMRRLGGNITRRAVVYVLVGIAITAGLSVSAGFIKYESNMRNVQPRGMEVTTAEDKLKKDFGLSSEFVLVLSSNEAAMREESEKLSKLPTVQAVESLATTIPSDQMSKLLVMSRIKKRIEKINPSWLNYVPPETLTVLQDIGASTLSIKDLPRDVQRKYRSADGFYATYVYPKKDMSKYENIAGFLRQIRSVSTDIAGFPVIVQDLTDSTKKGMSETTLLSAIAVLLMVVIDFQSLLPTVLAVLPLALSMLIMMGLITMFGMKFNIINIAVTPMILGIGVDFGLYILHRYDEEHGAGDRTIPNVLASTGKAILVSGGTVVLAFAILMFARYKGLSSLGVAAVIGIGAAVICSVTFLPAILRILEKRRKIGRAFAHLPGTVIDYPVPETEYEPPESEP